MKIVKLYWVLVKLTFVSHFFDSISETIHKSSSLLFVLTHLFNIKIRLQREIEMTNHIAHIRKKVQIQKSHMIISSLIETNLPYPVVVRVWRALQGGQLQMTLHTLNFDQWNNAFRFFCEYDDATVLRKTLLFSVKKKSSICMTKMRSPDWLCKNN